MTSWLDRLTGKQNKSAGAAKDRLHLVLINDRTALPPGTMEKIKDEIIAVISRHISIDPATVNLEITRDGNSQRLVADIPIKIARPRR